LPTELAVTARTEDGTIMAVKHIDYPVCGVQFHPEATLTRHGFRLLANFLHLAGINVKRDIERLADSEFRHTHAVEQKLPSKPVTF
jgi:gamma-glutamyl-gamma-aminobutyrate hydrolase PuuD